MPSPSIAQTSAFDYDSIKISPCTTGESVQDLCELLLRTMDTIMDRPSQHYEILGTPLHATMADGAGGIKPMAWFPEKVADYIFDKPDSTRFGIPESPAGRPSFISLPDDYPEYSIEKRKSFADHTVGCYNEAGTGKTIKSE